MKNIRIFIADDHKLMLAGLSTLIDSIEGFELAGAFPSGTEMIEALKKASPLPDICIVDIEMPGMNGVETVKAIRQLYPDLNLMALTMHQEWHFVNKMIAVGANGYLLKNADRDVFIATVKKVLAKDSFVAEGLNEKPPTATVELTEREREILRLIVAGKSNKEIADELFISSRTADTHRTNIKKKLGLSTLSQLMRYAIDHGIS